MRLSVAFMLILLFLPACTESGKGNEQGRGSVEVVECAAISPSSGHAFLLFNPPGYQVYYARSRCFRELAIEEREPAYCARVEERFSFFLDGSAYSEAACLKAVAERIAQDRGDAMRYLGTLHEIRAAAFSLNGNSRDFDFNFLAAGETARSHRLTLELFDGSERLGVLHENGYWLGEGRTELKVFIPAGDVRRVLGHRSLEQPWRVRVSLALIMNRFEGQYVPREQRQTEVFIEVDFSRLTWKPIAISPRPAG